MKKIFILLFALVLIITGYIFIHSSNDEVLDEEVISNTSIDKKEKSNNIKQIDKVDIINRDELLDNTDIIESKVNNTVEDKVSEEKTSYISSSVCNDVANETIKETPIVEETKAEEKQEVIVQEPVVIQEQTPSYACPNGIDQNVACDVIFDTNYYFATFSSEGEADSNGDYYMNKIMYINDLEITNYSVQPIYRNDRSIAYYGLNLWSDGVLIQ